MIVYISIGNSDDRLSQAEWAGFHAEVDRLVRSYVQVVHGEWVSQSAAPWQNACWRVEVSEESARMLRLMLAGAAKSFGQDSIAWAVAETEFIKPAT